MKKTIRYAMLALCVACMLVLAACGSSSAPSSSSSAASGSQTSSSSEATAQSTPEASAQAFLDAIQSGDADAIASVYWGRTLDLPQDAVSAICPAIENGAPIDISDEFKSQLSELIGSKLQSFEYTLGDVAVTGKKATVKANLKTYDFGDAIEEVVEEVMDEAFESSGNMSELDIQKLAVKELQEAFADVDKDYQKTVNIKLVRDGDTWKVRRLSKQPRLADALLGGIYSTAKDITQKMQDVSGVSSLA